MAGVHRDIAEPEQILFAKDRVVAPRGGGFLAVPRPCHHVGDRALWPVTVEHLQRQLLRRQQVLDPPQRHGDLSLHDAFGRLIACERPADEIVRAGIADVLDDGRVDIAQIDETTRQALRARGHRAARQSDTG